MNKFIILPLLGLFVLTGCSYSADKGNESSLETINEPIVVQTTNIADGLYQVDTEASVVRWDNSKITGVNHPGTVDVKTGSFEIKEGKLANGEVIIDMTTVKSDEKLDDLVVHLLGEDFFSVDTYPESKIVLKKMELDENTGKYMVEGDLTIKDVTNPISFPASVAQGVEGLGIVAEFEIDRTEWNVLWGSGKGLDNLKDKYLRDEIRYKLNIIANI